MDTDTESKEIPEIMPSDEITEPDVLDSNGEKKDQKGIILGTIILVVILIGVLVGFGFLLTLENETTARIRDVFIIFMALESLIIGLVLIILVVQLARLTNLLQNEIKPILDSTNETVSTLRGTTKFLSDNIVEPVIKLNEYFAGLQSVIKLVRTDKRKKKK